MLWLVTGVLGFILGSLIVYIVNQKKISIINKSCETQLSEKEKNLAILTVQIAEQKKHYDEINSTLKIQNEKYLSDLDLLRNKANQQSNLISQLKNQLENDQKRLNDLKDAKEDLSKEFKIVAQEVLEQKSKQHKDGLDLMLQPFKEQVKGFSERIEKYHLQGKEDQASLRTSLEKEVKNMMDLNQKMKTEADNLAKALKGDKKIQGNWGELILERVLETSGLRKDFEYSTQKSLKNEEREIFRPDVIVNLPDEKHIIIDSKVSLIAYERYIRAVEESEKNIALKQHIQSVRSHIDNLSSKRYDELEGIKSLDFVLLFMPIESAFVLAFQNDEKLFSDAFNKKIIVVTPTTLLATLRTIENIWRYERQNQNAQKIADRAQKMLDKFRGFVEDLEKMGDQLSKIRLTHEKTMDKLTKGRGHLIGQAEKLVALGVPMSKSLPKTITDQAEVYLNSDQDQIN